MVKRALDIVASAIGLVLLAVPFAVIGLAVTMESGRPVIFKQTRIGKGGRPFVMYKFRTMTQDAEKGGLLSVGEDPRITRTGGALRRYKLDELPQLLNVLRGDMSLVGPRPEVPKYAFVYPEQERVWSVRPGITDPTSIDLYDESALLDAADDAEKYYTEYLLPRKIERYLEYIETRSTFGDLVLVLRTLQRMVFERIGKRQSG